MQKVLYIKYGELNLKGKNKISFINTLISNIRSALNDYETIVKKQFDCAFVDVLDESNLNKVIDILKLVPGIQYIIIAHKIKRDLSLLEENISNYINPNKTFKLFVKRSDKTYELDSRQITLRVASFLFKNHKGNLKVDVRNPEQKIHIEIRQTEIIYYLDKINGIGGFPVGINGEALVLLSGGIDSPVASCLIQKKGITPNFITFMTPPYTSDEALEKVKKLIDVITLNHKLSNGILYIVDFTPILHEIKHISNEAYRITIMRRAFFEIANQICIKKKYMSIVTGESIGQVASQTLESMEVISQIIKNRLIMRPLLCMDKFEIINLAKKYNTYEISILPYDDSCTLFAPKKPTTKPRLDRVLKYEEELNLLKELISRSIELTLKGVVSHDK